jgi:flagellar biosynthesis protein FlhF
MKVKKYIATNMTEAMKQIRAELGDEAVILNSKFTNSGGLFGLFRKKQIEVIAAIDPKPSISEVKQKERKSNPRNLYVAENVQNSNLSKDSNGIHKEISDLKKMLKQFSNSPNSVHFDHYPDLIQEFLAKLEKQGISGQYIHQIANQLLQKWRLSQEEPQHSQVMKWGKEYLIDTLANIQQGGVNEQKKYVNLVGPTGVGKTTTLAKMAASAVLDKQKKVAFMTTDTYRIAAIEQLKTYANLLKVPVEVIYNLVDFHKAIEKFKDFDLVFIDTAGRNYREIQYIEELQKVIDFEQEIQTYLTLSLTMKEEDIVAIIDGFQSLEIDKFIFTKLDETSTYGAMLNIMMLYQKGTAYLTYGQDVPDDIEEATPSIIVKHLLEEKSK